MFDVITFGSATRDIFVRSQGFKIIDCDEFISGKAMAVGAGAKIYIDDLVFATGGGGTNTAATFALQGLKTAYVGLVGNDESGHEIKKELKDLGVETKFVKEIELAKTPCSIILSSEKERSILVYEGASHLLSEEDINWQEIKKTQWFYVAGLSGKSSEVFKKIIDFAFDNRIRIAVNPGKEQLGERLEELKGLLNKIDILLVNQEEASQITGIDFKEEEKLFSKFDELVSGIAVMSKGPEGVAVSDGQTIYRAGIPDSLYVDRTGSGDAFGSGFVAKIIKGGTIQEAIQFGTANATSTIQQVGAKKGLLKKDEWGPWPKVEVREEKLSNN